MPVIKRQEWLGLSPKGKLLHQVQLTIERLQKLQDDYNRGRASGKISEPIPFLEDSEGADSEKGH